MGNMGQKFQSSMWDYQATWKGDLVTHHKSVNVGKNSQCSGCDHQATQKAPYQATHKAPQNSVAKNSKVQASGNTEG